MLRLLDHISERKVVTRNVCDPFYSQACTVSVSGHQLEQSARKEAKLKFPGGVIDEAKAGASWAGRGGARKKRRLLFSTFLKSLGISPSKNGKKAGGEGKRRGQKFCNTMGIAIGSIQKRWVPSDEKSERNASDSCARFQQNVFLTRPGKE